MHYFLEIRMTEEPQVPPTSDVSYPLHVQYCGACTMPLEYCEYSNCKEKCREWLEKNLPDLAGGLSVTEGETTSDEKKHQVSCFFHFLLSLVEPLETWR